MNTLVLTGKRRTILISISILLVSIHTIYFYHAVRPEIDTSKLVQQGIRFILTVALLVVTYQGKLWARNLSVILYSIAIIGAIYGMTSFDINLVNQIPLMVMVIVYALAVYHFAFSLPFKAFFEYQNRDQSAREADE